MFYDKHIRGSSTSINLIYNISHRQNITKSAMNVIN